MVLYTIPLHECCYRYKCIDFSLKVKAREGASYKLLMALSKEFFTPNVSVPLFLEYESVTKRQGLVSKLNSQDIDSILEYFFSKSSIRKIFFLWRPYLKDSKDDLVLEVAVESQSEYTITFNTKDFKGCNKFGIVVVTPQEFITMRDIYL